MLAGFFVIGLVEAAHQLFKNGTHGMVIKPGQIPILLRTQVDILADEFLDNCAENVGFNHRIDLIAELELVQNLLHIRGESVQICLKVRLQFLCRRAACQIAQTEGRCITECLTGSIAECAL